LRFITKYFSFLSVIILFSACNPKVQLEKDEYLLRNLSFKGNKQIPTDELEAVIPPNQKPNSRFLGSNALPSFALARYQFGKNRYNEEKTTARFEKLNRELQALPRDSVSSKLDRKRQKLTKKRSQVQETFDKKISWFWRFVGQEPAILDLTKIEKTKERLELFISNKGFYDRKVSYQMDTLGDGRLKLTYIINENTPYIVSKVIYDAKDDKIDSLFKTFKKDALLNYGDLADWNKIREEKARLLLLLLNNGYYNFNRDFFENQMVDTFRVTHSAEIRFIAKQLNQKPTKFQIADVQFLAADLNNQESYTQKIDTTYYNNIEYIFSENKFPIKLLDARIKIRPNQFFSLENINQTKKYLFSLNQFSFINIQPRILPNNQMRLEIIAPTLNKYNLSLEPNFNLISNNSGSFLGGGLNGALRINNTLRRFDILEVGSRFSIDGSGIAAIASREFGFNTSITFPQFILPSRIASKLIAQNPKTQFGLGFTNSNTRYFNRTNFKINGSYSWQKSKNETFLFSFLDMNLINTIYKSDEDGIAFRKTLDTLLKQGNTLKVTFDPQFVSSLSASYIYNNQVQGVNVKAKYIKIFAESGGTFLGLLKDKSVDYDRIKWLDNLFPLRNDAVGDLEADTSRAYFRFVKFNFDFRKYIPVSLKGSFAYRFNLGLAIPYGKNEALPFDKNFFAGGPTSVRAWDIRGLGIGASPPNTFINANNRIQILPQPGDILIEGSVEYRDDLIKTSLGTFEYATFMDFGNVWKLKKTSGLEGANFEFNRFFREFGIAAGVGLRWNLDYFIFRFDFPVKVFDPSQPQGNRFVLDDFKFGRYIDKNDKTRLNFYRLPLRFGIGYPF
jgi:outer membrane protein insertion porin family